jgi:hypothetical protein
MQLLLYKAAVVCLFYCVLSGTLPFCHPLAQYHDVHGICPRPDCQVSVTWPPSTTAAGGIQSGGISLALRPAFPVQLHRFSAWLPDPKMVCGLIPWEKFLFLAV